MKWLRGRTSKVRVKPDLRNASNLNWEYDFRIGVAEVLVKDDQDSLPVIQEHKRNMQVRSEWSMDEKNRRLRWTN